MYDTMKPEDRIILDPKQVAEVTPKGAPGAGWYVGACLIPILGVILAAVAFGRNQIGPGLALIATSFVAFWVWAWVWVVILGLSY